MNVLLSSVPERKRPSQNNTYYLIENATAPWKVTELKKKTANKDGPALKPMELCLSGVWSAFPNTCKGHCTDLQASSYVDADPSRSIFSITETHLAALGPLRRSGESHLARPGTTQLPIRPVTFTDHDGDSDPVFRSTDPSGCHIDTAAPKTDRSQAGSNGRMMHHRIRYVTSARRPGDQRR